MDERGNVYALRGIPPYFILDSPHRSRISISRAYRRISSQGKQRIARSRIPRNPVRREFRPTRRSVGEREGGEGGGETRRAARRCSSFSIPAASESSMIIIRLAGFQAASHLHRIACTAHYTPALTIPIASGFLSRALTTHRPLSSFRA